MIAYYGEYPLTIVLSGTNEIKTNPDGGPYSGIYSEKSVTITGGTGGGSLKVSGRDNASFSNGINIQTNLTIENCTITAIGGNITDVSRGIYAIKDITISNSNVTATGGKGKTESIGIVSRENVIIKKNSLVIATQTGDESENDAGIYASTVIIEKDVSKVEATGHKCAINNVNTAIPGRGWETFDGQGSGSPINPSTDDQNISAYKKVCFHRHSFTYTLSQDGGTITATCGDSNCYLVNKTATLSISAPKSTVYNGNSIEAVIKDEDGIRGNAEVKYYKAKEDGTADGSKLAGAPKDAGKYRAEITVGEKTAYAVYEITKADPVLSDTLTASATYGDKLSAVSLDNQPHPTGVGNEGELAGSWSWAVADDTVSAGDAGTHTYPAEFTPESTNYNKIQKQITLSVAAKRLNEENTTNPAVGISITLNSAAFTYNGSQQAPTVSVADSGATITVDDYTLSYRRIKDAAGNAVTETPASEAPVQSGTYAQIVTGKRNYTGTVEKEFTISRKSITGASVKLDNTELTYNGSEQSVSVTGVTTTDGMTLTADDYDVSGNQGTDIKDYTVTVTGKGNFRDSAKTTWSIVGKKMTVSAEGYTGVYDGQAHGITVSVTDPESGAVVKYGTAEGTYDLDESPRITEIGTLTVYYKVTAADYADYTGSATVTITDRLTAVVTTAPAAKDLTYTGAAQELVTVGAAFGGTMLYALGADATTVPAEGWGTAVPGGTDPGTYYVWYKAVGDADHNDSAAACVTAEIKSAALTVTATGYTGAYDGQAHGITVTVVPAEGAAIAYGTMDGTYDLTASPTLTDVGTLTVYFKVSLAGYADYTGSAVVTISKADAAVTVAPAAVAGLVATGTPQALVTAGTASGGEMQYALGADAVTAPATGWSTVIPAGTDAGTYYVWYKAVGDANHNDSAAACVTVKIGEKEKIDISEATIGNIPDQTYTGKRIRPQLKVELNGFELVHGVDYKVHYKNNKKIGTASVQVEGMGDYKGETNKKTFHIIPKPVLNQKITVKRKGNNLVVSWKKNGKKLNGFEIQFSKDETFENSTSKWIKLNGKNKKKKAFSCTFNNITRGKTYYVRVRSYKWVTYSKKTKKLYSKWSKTVKKTLE